jgi:hypothetical protein
MSLNQLTIAKTFRVANFEGKLENSTTFIFRYSASKK